jgi:hypothetical protein
MFVALVATDGPAVGSVHSRSRGQLSTGAFARIWAALRGVQVPDGVALGSAGARC